MFCLSKNLCAPIGSMLVGNKQFITEAREKRRLVRFYFIQFLEI